MANTKSRARQLAEEWSEKPQKELDPEADDRDPHGSEDDSSQGDAAIGTEHYVDVGKSKLRSKDSASLGPAYRGARISRDMLVAESSGESTSDDEYGKDNDTLGESAEEEDGSGYDDPETETDQAKVTDDPEIDSDAAFGASDEERFKNFRFRGSRTTLTQEQRAKQRPMAADFMSSEETDDGHDAEGLFDEEAEESSDDNGGVGTDDLAEEDYGQDDGESHDESEEDVDMEDEGPSTDISASQSESEDGDKRSVEGRRTIQGLPSDPRAALRQLGQDTQHSLMSNLSDGLRKDVQKGLAVREQRKVFDGLLNIRIRLQKALVAANSFHVAENEDVANGEPYKAAEDAAIALWNSIEYCRASLLSSVKEGSGPKRPRSIDAGTSTKDIWEIMEKTERVASKRRKLTLDKWEKKTSRTKIRAGGGTPKSLVASLEEQIAHPERFIKRAQTPRSSAPIQQARKLNQDAEIYDDVDFYQRLLKDLVNQRTVDPSSEPGAGVATVRLAAVSEAKARKHVDRRASKGRKMRFTVHEKLQNFMAPDDRRSWEQPAIDRFFGTLFGQKLALNEDSSEEDDGLGAEEEGLRLFRS